jgi:hypothetical protein
MRDRASVPVRKRDDGPMGPVGALRLGRGLHGMLTTSLRDITLRHWGMPPLQCDGPNDITRISIRIVLLFGSRQWKQWHHLQLACNARVC